MGYPNHALVAFGGDLPSGEIWNCGVRVIGGNGGFLANPDNYLNDLYPLLQTWFSATANGMRNDASLKYVKANNINAAGKYNEGTTHIHTYGSPPTGGNVPWLLPFVSCAWSWTTAISRGMASKGRIYPPVTSGTQGGTNYLSGADTTKFIAGAKALLSALRLTGLGSPSEQPQISVVSPGTPKNGNVGASHQITGVRIGNVWDVQRRRKNQPPESYTGAAWP